MLIRQRAVAAGIGVDLGAVERDRAQLQHPDLAGELQHLNEQRLDLSEEASPERRNGVVIRVLVGGNEAERHRIITRSLQLAAGEHAGGVAVDQDAQQDARVIRRLTGTPVAAEHRPQLEARNHVHHEPSQMLLRQPFIHRWRHQETRVAVNRTEVLHASGPGNEGKIRLPRFYPRSIRDVKSDRLLEPLALASANGSGSSSLLLRASSPVRVQTQTGFALTLLHPHDAQRPAPSRPFVLSYTCPYLPGPAKLVQPGFAEAERCELAGCEIRLLPAPQPEPQMARRSPRQ